MPRIQKRDSAYYEARLKRDHPKTYADYKSGKYDSLREACIAVGLKKPTSKDRQMLNIWNKANQKERARFLNAIGSNHPTPSGTSKIQVTDSNGYLIPKVSSRILYIMQKRNIKMGAVMKEVGFSAYDQSLSSALKSNTRIKKPALCAALAIWLNANSSVK